MARTSSGRHSGREQGSGALNFRRHRTREEATHAGNAYSGRYGYEIRAAEDRPSRLLHASHSEALAAQGFQFSGLLPSGEGASLGYNGKRFHTVRLLNFTISAKMLINKISTSDKTHKMHHVVSSYASMYVRYKAKTRPARDAASNRIGVS